MLKSPLKRSRGEARAASFRPLTRRRVVAAPGPTQPLRWRVMQRVATARSSPQKRHNYSRVSGAAAAVAVLAVPGGPSTAAAEETVCDARLTVELSPGAPRVGVYGS